MIGRKRVASRSVQHDGGRMGQRRAAANSASARSPWPVTTISAPVEMQIERVEQRQVSEHVVRRARQQRREQRVPPLPPARVAGEAGSRTRFWAITPQ